MESYDITVHGRTVGAVKTSHGPGPSRECGSNGYAYPIVEQLGDRTVHCDPENDVTELQRGLP